MANDQGYVAAAEFCESVRDGTHDSPKPADFGRRLITSRHIIGGRLQLEDAYRISEADFLEINRRSKVDLWDVLISMIGTVGEPCLVRETPDFAIKNIGLLKTKNEVDAKWLYYYLRTPEAQHKIREQSRGTTQQYLPLGALREFPVRKAKSESYQREAVSILGALDDKIELNRRMNGTLESIAWALFQSWFVDFDPVRAKQQGRKPAGLDSAIAALFPSGFEKSKFEEIPSGWRLETLGSLAENASVPFDFRSSSRVVFVNTGDVFDGDFLHNDLSEATTLPGQAKKAIQRDDILFTEIRPANRRFAFADFDVANHVVSTKFMIIRSLGRIHQRLLYRNLTKQSTLAEFQIIAESRSGTFPQITFDAVSHLPIVLPPREIQNAFQSLVDPLDAKVKANKRQSQTLEALRDSLLPKLLSSELSICEVARAIG